MLPTQEQDSIHTATRDELQGVHVDVADKDLKMLTQVRIAY